MNNIFIAQVIVLIVWFVFFFIEDKIHKFLPWLDDIKMTLFTSGILYYLAKFSSQIDTHYSLGESGLEAYHVFAVLGFILLIVHLIERLGVVDIIESWQTGNAKKDHKMLSWVAFGLSGIIDNVAATDATIKSQDLTKNHNVTAQNSVNAANAGGAGSPIGDSTTVYLWQQGMISPGLILLMFIPSIVNNFVATWLSGKKVGAKDHFFDDHNVPLNWKHLTASGFSLGLIPFLKIFFHFEVHNAAIIGGGVMLGYFLFFTKIKMYKKKKNISKFGQFYNMLKPAILMALIVFQMTQLSYSGLLGEIATHISSWHVLVLVLALGLMSIVVDNMAVVAMAVHGLVKVYPKGLFFWYALAYSAGTAGSLNLPGSSSGLTLKKRAEAEANEKGVDCPINTISYLKESGLPNLLGWIAGMIVLVIMFYTINGIFNPL